MDVGEQLLDDLMRFRPESLTANAWAVKAGVSRAIWGDIRRHGNPSRRTLEKLLAAADSSLAEFEALRVVPVGPIESPGLAEQVGDVVRPWRQPGLPSLPVVDSRQAGEWGEVGSGVELISIGFDQVADRISRPASLAADPDAYAVTIIGDSMWPRYRPGRRVAISPAMPVAIGDDVLVLLGGGEQGRREALLKELVRRSAASIELRQFNPDATFSVPMGEIQSIHKVAGEHF